jgi:hypothetical protein
MAVRKPLVIKNGQIQQLQAGDMLTGQNLSIDLTNSSGSVTVNKCTPVYIVSDGQFFTSINTSEAPHRAVGFAAETIGPSTTGPVQLIGVLEATQAEWNTVTGGTGGLGPGLTYYIDTGSPNVLTSVPTSTDSQYVKKVGIAATDTQLIIDPDISVLL